MSKFKNTYIVRHREYLWNCSFSGDLKITLKINSSTPIILICVASSVEYIYMQLQPRELIALTYISTCRSTWLRNREVVLTRSSTFDSPECGVGRWIERKRRYNVVKEYMLRKKLWAVCQLRESYSFWNLSDARSIYSFYFSSEKLVTQSGVSNAFLRPFLKFRNMFF